MGESTWLTVVAGCSFGKYMDMQFNYGGDPIGGVITDYLLEKVRCLLESPRVYMCVCMVS